MQPGPGLYNIADAIRAAADKAPPPPEPAPLSATHKWNASRAKVSAANAAIKKLEDRAGRLATQIDSTQTRLKGLVEDQTKLHEELERERAISEKIVFEHRELPVPCGEPLPKEANKHNVGGTADDEMAVDLDEKFTKLRNPDGLSSEQYTDEKLQARLAKLRELLAADNASAKRRETADERPSPVRE